MATQTKRVAIVGASGIGRHHANWWHTEGAEVCAFVGRSQESNAATTIKLQNLFPFQGKAYTDLDTMLAAERPDIVDVSSPHACHVDHAIAALKTGADVLCEKPLIFDPNLTPQQMMARCSQLRDVVTETGRLFCMCAQMAVGAEICHKTWADNGGGEVVELEFTLKSPAAAHPAYTHASVWADLGPHMVAAMLKMFPGETTIELSSICVECAENAEAIVRFTMAATNFCIPVRMTSGKTVGEPKHVRQITINGDLFDIGNAVGEDGCYCAEIVSDFDVDKRPDLMRLMIRKFLRGESVIEVDAAVRNQELLLMIHDVIARG